MSDSVEELLGALVRAKQEEATAKALRVTIEERLLGMIADKPEKGRAKLEGGPIKATIEFKLNYKADVDAILALTRGNGVAPGLVPLKLIPESYDFDSKAYEELRARDPATFAKVAAHVTTKPAKPSFELKL